MCDLSADAQKFDATGQSMTVDHSVSIHTKNNCGCTSCSLRTIKLTPNVKLTEIHHVCEQTK